MTKLTKMDYLVNIQNELKAPKNQFNNFGKYKYRSAEDILEALKPLLKKYNCYLTITETTKEIAGYLVLTSKVSISNGDSTIFVEAQAGINPDRKGMDLAQSFGSSSSYAKKYALGNLFLLDDTKDADSTTNPNHKLTSFTSASILISFAGTISSSSLLNQLLSNKPLSNQLQPPKVKRVTMASGKIFNWLDIMGRAELINCI